MATLLVVINLLNCLFFHLSRNLILYTESVSVTKECIGDLWRMGVIASMATLVALVMLRWLDALEGAIVFAFTFNQSLHERRLEIFRSTLSFKRYLQTACARPILNMVGLATLMWLSEADISPLAFLSVLALSPLLACFAKRSSGDAWLTWRKPAWKAATFLLPKAMMVTVAASYLFWADAALKYVSRTVLSGDDFGEYAVLSDLLLPGLWVLSSALAWDFVPTIVRTDSTGKMRAFVSKTLSMAVLLVVVLVVAFLIPDICWQGKQVSVQKQLPLVAAVSLSVYLSTIAFPVLIVTDRLVISVLLSVGGVVAMMFIFMFLRLSGFGWPLLFHPSWLLLGVNVVVVLLVIVMIFKEETHGLGVKKGKMHSFC